MSQGTIPVFLRETSTGIHLASLHRQGAIAWQSSVFYSFQRDFYGEPPLQHISMKVVIRILKCIVGSSKGISPLVCSVGKRPTGGRWQKTILHWQSRWEIMRCD